MIDRSLNYGRHLIRKFIKNSNSGIGILDIGAGNGIDLTYAKSIYEDSQLFAIENYPEYVINLKSQGFEVFGIDIEKDEFPFENESLDIIIINQVFEHVKEVFWILNEITRTLKINGNLIVGVPNLASLHNRVLLGLGKQPTSIQNNSAHLRGYTLGDFRALLNSGFTGGYELKEYGGSNFYPFPRPIAKLLAKILPTLSWGIFMRWMKVKSYQNSGFLTYPKDQKLETNFYLGN